MAAAEPPPGRRSERAMALPDGRTVRVRPIRHDDAPRLVQAFERLSDESRYRRFLSPTDHLTTGMVEYLTSVDHLVHEALVALDESGAIVGVARFIRSQDEPWTAEVAVTVVDDWQSDGVGTVLMEQLIHRARELDIARLTGDVLSENLKMHQLLRDFGPLQIINREAGVESFSLPIGDTDAADGAA